MIAFFQKSPKIPKKLFKGDKAKKGLEVVLNELQASKEWVSQAIYKKVKSICEQGKFPKKPFFVNLYVAIEGKQSGLPVFESMEILGKKESLKRLTRALHHLRG